MKWKFIQISLIFTLLLTPTISFSVEADNCNGKPKEICASGSFWYEATKTHLRVEEEGYQYYSDWVFTIPDQLNISIEIDQQYDETINQGVAMIVSGRMMLSKGIDLKPGYEIDVIDGPILMYQLLISLLDQSIPEGPSQVRENHTINKNEEEKSIKIATTSASGNFLPPWTINGTINRENPYKINYKLQFSFSGGDKKRKFYLSGYWSKPKVAPMFDDSLKLEGWNMHSLGPIIIKQENGTIYDYGASKKELSIRTLGELKSYMQEQEKSSNQSLNSTPKSGAN